MSALEIDGEFLDHAFELSIGHKPVLVYRVRVTPAYGAPLVVTVWAQRRSRNRIHYWAGFGSQPRSGFRGAYSLEPVIRSANYRARRYAAAYRKPRGIPVPRAVPA